MDYCSAELTSCAMKSSTAEPAFTSIMTRLGFFNLDTISSIDLAPMTFVPGECGVCKWKLFRSKSNPTGFVMGHKGMNSNKINFQGRYNRRFCRCGSVNFKGKGKVCTWAKWCYLSFCCMKQLEVLRLPLDGIPVCHKVHHFHHTYPKGCWQK